MRSDCGRLTAIHQPLMSPVLLLPLPGLSVYTAGPSASPHSLPPALHSVPLHYLGRDHHVHSADVCTDLPHRNVNNSAQDGCDAVLFNNKGGFVLQLGGVKTTESISESKLKSEPQLLQRSPKNGPKHTTATCLFTSIPALQQNNISQSLSTLSSVRLRPAAVNCQISSQRWSECGQTK